MTLPLERRGPAFAATLAQRGAAPALLLQGDAVSYAALARRVTVRQAELGPTRRLVVLTMTADLECVVTYLACLAGGHPVLLTSAEAAPDLVSSYDPDVVASAHGLQVRREGTAHDLHPDLAVLLSTSGSTGSPKLVRLSADNLQTNADAIAASLGIRSDDRAITSLPLHYCYGLSLLHSHLAAGAATVLTSLSVVDPCFWRLFREQRATTLAGVPHTFSLLERIGFGDLELPSLRYVTQAGGRLAPERVRALAQLGQRRGWDLVVMYGQTEATARMAYLPADLAAEHPGAIGVAVPGGELALEGVEDGIGELVYRGPNVMLGYATTPADLSLGPTTDVLHTGDLARRTAAGLFEVVGRRSRFVKVFGLRIDLDRVEAALGDVACTARDDELIVFTTGPAQVRERAARAAGLPPSAVKAVTVDELPRTTAGKLDRPALDRLTVPTAVSGPATSVTDVYARVLERSDIAPGHSFVDLGGDSLSYVEASVLLEDVLGDLPAGWHLMTVAELDRWRRPSRRWTRAIDTSVLLRAVAILLIVAQHSDVVRVLGGAHLLLGVAGFNFARFQLTGLPRAQRMGRLLRSTARIVIPSVVAIAGTTAVIGRYSWEHLLLVHDVVSPGTTFKDFWFVEVLVQLLLVAAVLLVVLDRFERRWPFALPLVVLAVGLLARFGVLPALEGRERLYAPYAVAWIFVWGWAAAKASTTPHRLLLSAVIAVALPGFFMGQPSRELFVGIGLLLVLWVPTVRVPRVLTAAIAVVAASSLYVYVTHVLVLAYLRPVPLLAFAASFAVGIAYWRLCSRYLSRSGTVSASPRTC
jgi:hypothetical protein